PAAAAASALGLIVGVLGRSEDRVERMRPKPEFGHVGFANDQRPGAANALDDQAVTLGIVVDVQGRSLRRREANRVNEVLYRMEKTVQRPDRLAFRQSVIRLVRQLQRLLIVELGNDRSEERRVGKSVV